MTKQFNILGQTYNLDADDMVIFNKTKELIIENIWEKIGKIRAILDGAIEQMGSLSASQCNGIINKQFKLEGVNKFIDVEWNDNVGVKEMYINDDKALIEALAIRYMWEAEVETAQEEFDEMEAEMEAEDDEDDEDDEAIHNLLDDEDYEAMNDEDFETMIAEDDCDEIEIEIDMDKLIKLLKENPDKSMHEVSKEYCGCK